MTIWLIMRSTGLLAMLLLTVTIILGVISSAPHRSTAWPRFLTQALHRNVALLSVALIVAHVATAVADSHAGINLVHVVVPFGAEYRPIFIGLGTVAVDLLLAVLLTTAVRSRLGGRSWRAVHWLAYACWPAAMVHGLGAGTDVRVPVVVGLTAACLAAVLFVMAWRVAGDLKPTRLAAVLTAFAVAGGGAAWAATGPFDPNWSKRVEATQ